MVRACAGEQAPSSFSPIHGHRHKCLLFKVGCSLRRLAPVWSEASQLSQPNQCSQVASHSFGSVSLGPSPLRVSYLSSVLQPLHGSQHPAGRGDPLASSNGNHKRAPLPGRLMGNRPTPVLPSRGRQHPGRCLVIQRKSHRVATPCGSDSDASLSLGAAPNQPLCLSTKCSTSRVLLNQSQGHGSSGN